MGLFSTLLHLSALAMSHVVRSSHERGCWTTLTKLKVQQAQLLFWVIAVALLNGDGSRRTRGQDTRLYSPYVRPTLDQLLICTHMMPTDARRMTAKYGHAGNS